MTSSLEARIRAVDATILSPIVQQALNCVGGTLTEWAVEPIRPIAGGMGASVIYRFSGLLEHQDESIPWSLILKVASGAIVKPGGGAVDALSLRRESLFYGSDLIQEIPAGFRPAHCYSLHEQSDESGHPEWWLWLEDLSSVANKRWTVDDYYHAAYGLGLFNGAFLNHDSLARAPWVQTGSVRTYMERAEPQLQALVTNRTNPLIQRAFPPDVVDGLVALWQCREEHLQTLDRVLQTLCHGDAQATNLFLRQSAADHLETVAIDWGDVSHGPVGLDAVQLLNVTLFGVEFSLDQVRELTQTIYTGYLAGIQATGWQGDPSFIRLGYTASMIRSIALIMMRSIQLFLDLAMQAYAAPYLQAHGITLEDIANRILHIQQLPHELFAESHVLRAQLL